MAGPVRAVGRRPPRRALHRYAGHRRLPWCALLLLAAALLPAQQPATVMVRASSTVAQLSGDRLAASVAWLLGEWYGPALQASAATDDRDADATRLLLALTAGDRGLQLRSELVGHGRSLGERNSWLPAGSLGAVTATAAGDGFLLWSEARRFPHLDRLAAPPRRTAMLPVGGVARLLQRPVSGRDVQAAAAYPGGVLVLLADGPIALGRRFEIVPDTAAWLTWREGPAASGAPWRNLFPLHDGRVVLEPWSGAAIVTAAEHAAGQPDLPAGLLDGSSAAAAAGALLAVAPDGTAAWQGLGEVVIRGAGAAEPATLRLPPGSYHPSATAADGGGAWWTFDPRERRIRAFAATDGGVRQVQAITPILPAEELGGTQALAVTADGGFLIGSQRAVWHVDRRGMPRWALRLLHEQPRQRLPQAFSLTAGVERDAFFLLDRSTGGVHRFAGRPDPEPEAGAHLTSADAPKPGAVAAALTDSALHAAQRAWQRRQPHAAALLLTAAGHSLKRWHAADPLAEGVRQRTTAIEQLGATVEQALYGAPPLAPRIAPSSFHPALGAYYEAHPFALTVRNGARDRAPAAVEVGIAGAASAITVATPAMAPGEEATVPIQLSAPAGAGSTGVARHTALWLSADAGADSGPVLSAMPLTVQPERCLPEQAVATPAGAAHAAFLGWHLAAAAAAPGMPLPAGLSSYQLVDRVARLADVGTSDRCLQTADRTLAALFGSATDWALAVAGALHRHGTPAALLVTDAPGGAAAQVLVLAWLEQHGEAVDPEAPSLPLPARQQLAEHLERAGQRIPPGRAWALRPHALAAGEGGAVAWSAAGADAAAAALEMAAARVHILGADAGVGGAANRTQAPSLQPVLPLGGEHR